MKAMLHGMAFPLKRLETTIELNVDQGNALSDTTSDLESPHWAV